MSSYNVGNEETIKNRRKKETERRQQKCNITEEQYEELRARLMDVGDGRPAPDNQWKSNQRKKESILPAGTLTGQDRPLARGEARRAAKGD